MITLLKGSASYLAAVPSFAAAIGLSVYVSDRLVGLGLDGRWLFSIWWPASCAIYLLVYYVTDALVTPFGQKAVPTMTFHDRKPK